MLRASVRLSQLAALIESARGAEETALIRLAVGDAKTIGAGAAALESEVSLDRATKACGEMIEGEPEDVGGELPWVTAGKVVRRLRREIVRALLCAAYWAAHAERNPGARGEVAVGLVRMVAKQIGVEPKAALELLDRAAQQRERQDLLLVAIYLQQILAEKPEGSTGA